VAHEKAVNGEITALDVLFGSLGIDDLIGMAAIGIAEIRAECGDLDLEGIAPDEDDAELRADIEAVGKQAENFSGSGVGSDVVIGGITLEENIAHAATDEEGLVAVALKSVANRIGELAGIHGMIMRQRQLGN
jgi:hypothetical protein